MSRKKRRKMSFVVGAQLRAKRGGQTCERKPGAYFEFGGPLTVWKWILNDDLEFELKFKMELRIWLLKMDDVLRFGIVGF